MKKFLIIGFIVGLIFGIFVSNLFMDSKINSCEAKVNEYKNKLIKALYIYQNLVSKVEEANEKINYAKNYTYNCYEMREAIEDLETIDF